MRRASHEPGKLNATAKTHKFNSLDDITVDNLKFRPIIPQIETYTYSASNIYVKTNIKLMMLKNLHQ